MTAAAVFSAVGSMTALPRFRMMNDRSFQLCATTKTAAIANARSHAESQARSSEEPLDGVECMTEAPERHDGDWLIV